MTESLSHLSNEELDANINEADRIRCEFIQERKRRQEEKARAIEALASNPAALTYFESVSVANGVISKWRYGDLELVFNNGSPTLVSVADKQVWPAQDANPVRAEDKR